ncbi:MAG: YceI family protein [Candidatus Velthaea sp.]
MTTTADSTRTYAIDGSHSSVHFSVRHLMISKVRGTFSTVAGTIELPAAGVIPVALSVTIDAASIDTREAQRDGHLKSADFLDVEKFPVLRFTSTSIRATTGQSFEITGDLEIRGTTRPVTLAAGVAGQGKDPWGNDRVAYEATAKISRKAWGLTWNQALEAGGVAVGDEIDITLDVESIPAQN